MNLGIAHVDTLLRWLHVLAGIVWVGHLCFFNFVGGPFLASLDAETKKKIYPGLMGRALWWFRWGAMATLVFGVALFLFAMMKLGLYSKGPDGEFPGRMRFIMWGMTFAVILWINVWFVIWPAQKKIIAAFSRGDAPPAGLPQRADAHHDGGRWATRCFQLRRSRPGHRRRGCRDAYAHEPRQDRRPSRLTPHRR